MDEQHNRAALPPIAIIGMAVRFPGAQNPEDFWRNLRDSVESISTFTDAELEPAMADAKSVGDPRYVKRRAILNDVEVFDAQFFGYTLREAELTDPQQRVFLQCAYEALESAGHDPERFEGSIGVFGGAGFSHYLYANLLSNRALMESTGLLQVSIRNRPDHLTTNVAYKLNLHGPAVTVQTACSTSLSAVHLACQSLIGYECDMALAGGVSIALPQKSGYLYQEGGILSPDGRCRAFDAEARGTVHGNGAGVVVLRRLEDALRDGDHIDAVILGSAMNNDGSLKVGYTAPSVEGQAQVIAEAQLASGVDPDTVTFVEAHGTGTSMGDPVEVAALAQAFGQSAHGRCAIGSVKTNIGHLDTAAGVAGLVKTVLSLRHRMLPASLHFREANPEINFPASRFFVNAQLREWNAPGLRRAGVSSFGIGGTNVHVIVEEAPPAPAAQPSRPWQLLLLSARTRAALEAATSNLAAFLEKNQDAALADVACTLQTGRREFDHRRAIVCSDREDALRAMRSLNHDKVATGIRAGSPAPVFIFPGEGSGYIHMARGLYTAEPVFRSWVDRCAQMLHPHLGIDLLEAIYPQRHTSESAGVLAESRIAQPALFVIEYALARLWMEWGVEPRALIGHGLGEYVAATLAGVFSLEHALALIAARGRRMQGLLPGAMSPDPLAEAFKKITLHPPQIPCISSLSGQWITAEQATAPQYWLSLSRELARSQDGDGLLPFMKDPDWLLLQVGPGSTLNDVAQQNPERPSGQMILNSLRSSDDPVDDEYFLLGALGKLWLAGVRIEWKNFYQHEQRRRVPLPVYPFEPQRCWIAPQPAAEPVSTPARRPEVAGWFHAPSWKRAPLTRRQREDHTRPWLVFCDRFGLGTRLAEQLRSAGEEVFTVHEGPGFLRRENAITLRSRIAQDYQSLLSALHESGRFPSRIVHLWNLADSHESDDHDPDDFDAAFWSPMFMAQALGSLTGAPPTELLLVSNFLYDVTGEAVWHPRRATLLGPCRVIPLEYPGMICRHIDLDLAPPQIASVELARMMVEFSSGVQEKIVAYRNGHRWVQIFEPLSMPPRPETAALRQRGTYLITGGMGGIGLVIAEQLAEAVQARLVLAGRSQFPARELWPQWLQTHPEADETSARIRKVMSLEKLGAEVLIVSADVSSRAQVRSLISMARERFGEIHGVVHAAGVAGGGVIQLKTPEMAASVMAPKVAGVMALAAELRNTPLDFFIACSSRASILGAFGQVDYCAANSFLDVFAHSSHRTGGQRITSVNWDAWQTVGMLATMAGKLGIAAGTATAQVRHPLLGAGAAESPERQVFATTISPATHWLVDEHRIQGHAVMPGVAYLEMARAAFRPAVEGAIEIRDALFVAPLYFRDDHPREVKVVLEKKGERQSFHILSRAMASPPAEDWQEHANGSLRQIGRGPVRRHDLEAIRVRCGGSLSVAADESWKGKVEDEDMGPRWKVCSRVYLGDRELLAFLELPERFASELAQMEFYPTLVDRAAATAKQFLIDEGIYLPLGYGCVRIHRPLERRVYAHIRLRSAPKAGRQTVSFDMLLMNEQGEELVEIEEITEKRISDPAVSAGAVLNRGHRSLSGEPGAVHDAGTSDMVAAAYAASLRHGILPNEGKEAFRFILGLRELPQVIVSTEDFAISVAEAAAGRPPAATLRQSSPVQEVRPAHPRPAMEIGYAAAGNLLEQSMAEVWQKVLGIDQIGVHDNYFDLGGDSVQAIQIVAQLNELGLQLTPQKLFQYQTIGELAAIASRETVSEEDSSRTAAAGDRTAPAEAELGRFALAGLDEADLREIIGSAEESRIGNVDDIYPLSPLQEGILFHALLDRGGGAYVVHLSFRVEGPVHRDAFKRAWQKILERHPVLRTSFVWERAGKPLQVVRRQVELAWDERDWSGLAVDDQERQLQEYLREEHHRGFDPAQAPLMRMALLSLGPERHQFVWNYSHLLLDGWSANNIFAELSAWYRAYCDGRELEMSRPIPYRDFIQWLLQQDQSAAETFWRGTLKGFDTPTPLGAADFHSNGEPGSTHPERSGSLGREITAKLQSAARRHRLTPGAWVEGAWARLIAIYGRTSDVLFGVTVAGRPASLSGVESMVGVLANTLPLRVIIRDDQPLTDWLRTIQDHQSEMGDYEYSSLVEIKGWSEVPGPLPLFESFLVFENHPIAEGARQLHGNVRLDPARAFGGATYPLALRVEPGEDFLLRVIFDPARFRSATAERILNQVRTLLAGMAENPEQKVGELSLCSPEERQQIIEGWNHTREPRASGITLQELFEQQVLTAPGRVAVEDDSGALTYFELNQQANRLAHDLRRRGAGPEARVGICVERSLEMMVAVLAVLKSGAAYVPLDPRDPAARLALIFQDARLSMLLTQSSLLAALPSCDAEIVCLDRDRQSTAALETEENPVPLVQPRNAACVIYTSGSTGVPRGVVVEHQSLLNYLLWAVKQVFADGIECLPAISSLGFDASFKQLLAPLLAGRSVLLVNDLSGGPREILRLLAARGRSALNCVPSLWQQILEVVESDPGSAPPDFSCLLLGGESFSPELIARSLRALPQLRISNLYGPTEATANATYAASITHESVSIGRPVANTSAYVLDGYLAPLPVGAAGELYIGGEAVARGYLNHPEWTAAKFVPSPFGGGPGRRLYRTGDIARWNAAGNLEFLGRDDQQIKIRGFRIELGEIEAAARAHPDVDQAVVTARPGRAGERILVAYATPRGDRTIAVEHLRGFLEQRLPRYMTPGSIIVLPSLPLTASGKVDRKSLPEPRSAREVRRLPRTPQEEILCEIFAEVSGEPEIGIDDDFFDLGGNSLLAMRLAGRIRAVLGMELPLSDIFSGPTVAHLAGRLSPVQGSRPPLAPMKRPEHVPLSHAQRRLWFLDQLEGGSAEYNVSEALRLQGPLDCGAVERAIQGIVDRHEALRTRFVQIEGEPVQVILPGLKVDVPVEDLSGLNGHRQNERIEAIWKERLQPMDLARGPLLRVRLVRLGEHDYILFRTVHHIVWDGWSAGVFNREFAALYEAVRGAGNGESGTRELEPLAVQPADFALWQREWLDHQAMALRINDWRESLAGIPEQLDVSVDHPRGARRTYAGDFCQVTLAPESLGALKKLAHSGHASLYMSLLAALGVLLERHSGQTDIVIGSPVLNRPDPQLEAMIGCFVNFLVMRVDVDSQGSFLHLLSRVRARALEAYRCQDLPFERLVEELAPQRRLNTAPIFQVVLAMQNAPARPAQLEGLQIDPVPPAEIRVRHDLELHVREQEGRLDLYWLYNRDLFDRWRIKQMAERYVRLLEAAVAAPESALYRLEMLTPEEHRQLLEGFNATDRDLPALTVSAAFEEQVTIAPDSEAVICGDRSMTYGELNARADHLAFQIRKMGAEPGALVGVALERSLEMVVALVGILKAGAAYLPLAGDLPAHRREELMADARLQHVITTAGNCAGYGPLVEHVLAVDSLAPVDTFTSGYESKALPASAAYVNYTSGSTGKPKGVLVPHAAIMRLVWNPDFVRLGPFSRILQMAPLSFDAATFEIWGALLNGGCLVLMPAGPASIPEIGGALARHRVNTLWLTAGLFHEIVDDDLTVLAGIEQLLAGGDVLSAEHVRRMQSALPGCRIINGYGPTENTTFSCCYTVPEKAEMSKGVPIGFPVWNTRAYVLDSTLSPSPIGVTGELYVAGSGLARGYLYHPALTAERFVADPFTSATGTRMYRTGDLVCRNRQGALEFVGRVDRQVKVRGFRIELQEIESVLARVTEVKQCAVLAWQQEFEGKQLVAYVVSQPDASPSVASLRHALAEQLPGYMIPADFIVLDAFPLTENGKLDRKALPRPGRRLEGSYRAPRTPIEELLCDIFAGVLKTPQVGIDDNFFDLGGHSLMATRLASRIRAMLGVEIALRAIFESPTVAELVTRLPQAGRSRPPLTVQLRPERLPLSYAQHRLWFIDELEKTSIQYNVPAALRINGELDLAAMKYAINGIVYRHESLRTRFIEVEGDAVQVIEPSLEVDVPVRDLSGADELLRNERVHEALRQEREQPFHLGRGPLLRAKLLRLGPREHILMITFHHIVTDGWSLGIFNREFVTLYEAFQRAGGPCEDPMEPLPVQYADFTLWQRSWLGPEAMAHELQYWKAQLADIPEQLVLPQDRPRQVRQTFAAEVCSLTLEQAETALLRQFAQASNATLYMVLLSCLAALLERYSGQTDIVIGSPIANRQDSQLEGLIGFFVNSLVMRVQVEPESSFTALLAQARRIALEAYQHQDLPFERLVEELAPRRSLNTPPLFQVLLALQNAPTEAHRLQGCEVRPLPSHEIRVRLDLELHAREDQGRLELHWVYNRDLFDRWRMEQMARHYARLLEAFVRWSDRPLREISELTEEERRQILVEWNSAGMDVPALCVHEFFELQARRTPDVLAATGRRESFTYSELNRHANRIAGALRVLGVAPEHKVAICMDRGPRMVAALLGVMKAGGAYVPLDPKYPEERLSYMLRDSEARVLLVDSRQTDKMSFYEGAMVDLDRHWQPVEEAYSPNPARSVTPENLAYVIYTSGSTGGPKGVAIQHRSAATLLRWAPEVYTPEDLAGVLASTSICFDLSVFEIFVPLSYGGTVVMVEDALDWGELAGLAPVTLINTVPSVIREMVRAQAVPASVRTINLAGEALPGELVHEIYESTGVQRVFNLYGPSEDTTYSTFAPLSRAPSNWLVPIGRPVANTRTYVLNDWMEPVPVGVSGELYLSGDGMARGYLNRGDLTAGRFVPNPFGPRGGERMYRTGDLARYMRDGNLEFLGRADQQVKVRGFRIEMGEIESVLLRQPDVGEAVVMVREDRPGDRRLVAYIVPALPAQIDLDDLRQRLRQTLPDFMVPAVMVPLQALPLTPNRKVDRKALPAPEQLAEPQAPAPPRTELERIIAGIWQDVLELENIGVHDNFFDRGGHSILAKLVQARLHTALGREIELVRLFQFPTIATLAQFLEGSHEPAAGPRGGQERVALQKEASSRLRRARVS